MQGIVVTGMGIISAMGVGKEASSRCLLGGSTAVHPTAYLGTRHSELPCGEVPYSDGDLREYLGIDMKRPVNRTALLGRVALREALEQSALNDRCPGSVAFISGTTVGGMEKTELHWREFLNADDSDGYVAIHDCGSSTNLMAEEYKGVFSIVTTPSTACSSAANAIILGANLIRAGIVEAAVCGGAECLSKFHLNGFNSLMILDKEPCRPFDSSRAGLNLGEGAAYIVLESEKSANERGVNTICALAGYGNACDAFHQTATSPDGEGAYLAMKEALDSAGLSAAAIDYVNAHGTGTQNNDESEGRAIERIFGDRIPAVSSTKAFTGHTTSAAGGIEAVISILALTESFIPANLNFKSRIEGLKWSPVAKTVKGLALKNVMNNSFGFGGNDSSLIFSRI